MLKKLELRKTELKCLTSRLNLLPKLTKFLLNSFMSFIGCQLLNNKYTKTYQTKIFPD